jgi:hypothetical protein
MTDSQKIYRRWFIFPDEDQKFPYNLFIEKTPNKFLHLKSQEKWPGPGKNIFCKFEGEIDENDLPKTEPLESCNILSLNEYGRKLGVILDRKLKKRCYFIFLKKKYKTKDEYYHQVFWFTQSQVVSERRGAYIPKIKNKDELKVVIDINERYPYKFGNAKIEKKKLPIGDYALEKDGKIIAICERKTRDNFLHEISTFDAFRMKLQEMQSYKYKSVIFESPYADFINPKKLKFYSAPYVADIIAQIFVEFPDVQFVFCSNRKIAENWVYRWFLRINSILSE